MARDQWLRRQQSLRNGDAKVERELIQKVKPLKKQKPEKKPVSYPYEIQRRLYNDQYRQQEEYYDQDEMYRRQQEQQQCYQECGSEKISQVWKIQCKSQQQFQNAPKLPPKLRSNKAEIKFTPAQVQAKVVGSNQQKFQKSPTIDDICSDLNRPSEVKNEQEKTEELSELQMFRRKYLGDTKEAQTKSQDPLQYLDISENLKNIQKLKSQLQPVTQQPNFDLNYPSDDFSLIPKIKRDPIPNFFNNDLLTNSNNMQKRQEQNKFNYTPSTNLYSQYIPEPNVNYPYYPTQAKNQQVYEPKLLLNPSIQNESNLSKLSSTLDDTYQRKNIYNPLPTPPPPQQQQQQQFMNISNNLHWLDGNVQNPLKFQVKDSLSSYQKQNSNNIWSEDDCPEEPRSYQVQQINQLSQNQKLPHLAGPPSTSLSIRSHMQVF